MSIDKITELQRIKLDEGEALIIKYQFDGMPASRREAATKHIFTVFSTMLLTTNILVVDSSTEFLTIKNNAKDEKNDV